MPSSVPTTRPPHDREWYAWIDPLAGPGLPWQYESVLLWRLGWRQAWEVEPRIGEQHWNAAGLYWTPNGRRLTTGEAVGRLIRDKPTDTAH